MVKKRIIKKYEQLAPELMKMLKKAFPDGFEDALISFETPKGDIQLALPFETEDTSYLIKMPKDVSFDEEDNDNGNDTVMVGDNDFNDLDSIAGDDDSDD